MDLLEHQGKALFVEAGLPVLPYGVAHDGAAAAALAGEIGLPVAVKAQVRTGGRGKAGGVRVCTTPTEVERAAVAILGGSVHGHVVEALLVEPAVAIHRELYLAISSSRARRGPVLVFCREGGVDINEVAGRDPGALVSAPIDPLLGLCDYHVRDVLAAARLDAAPQAQDGGPTPQALGAVVRAAWRLFHERDATLVEVNPLVVTATGALVCLDSKVSIDDNALYRQTDLSPEEPRDEREARARTHGLSFVGLDGDIAVLGNGAGLVMSTIDQIAAAGGRAADFCDIGGGAKAEVVGAALDTILSGGDVAAVLVNIFGGITRCDEVARGLVDVFSRRRVKQPVVVRLDGNAAEEGQAVLTDAALAGLSVVNDPAEAVELAVAASCARRRRGGVA
jgi:succinyl-CoA synthetase beta subunit